MDSVYIITRHATFLLTNYADIQRKSKSNTNKIVRWPSCKNHFLFWVWQCDDVHGGILGVCLFTGLEPVTGALEWSTGVERWSGVLEWTTGVASGVCLSYFLYGINNKNMYV